MSNYKMGDVYEVSPILFGLMGWQVTARWPHVSDPVALDTYSTKQEAVDAATEEAKFWLERMQLKATIVIRNRWYAVTRVDKYGL